MTVYQPLHDYLSQHPDSAVELGYTEIEELIGRKLPPTAYGNNKRQWWANTETHSQALAWLRANRKAKLDVQRERVTFIKATTSPQSPAVNEPVQLPGLSAAARRMLEDVAEERGVDLAAAAAGVLNEMALRRRAATIDWFAGRSGFSETSSASLIREDRDGR